MFMHRTRRAMSNFAFLIKQFWTTIELCMMNRLGYFGDNRSNRVLIQSFWFQIAWKRRHSGWQRKATMLGDEVKQNFMIVDNELFPNAHPRHYLHYRRPLYNGPFVGFSPKLRGYIPSYFNRDLRQIQLILLRLPFQTGSGCSPLGFMIWQKLRSRSLYLCRCRGVSRCEQVSVP